MKNIIENWSVRRVQEGSKARYGSAVEIHGPSPWYIDLRNLKLWCKTLDRN